jgi:hypothetical protein
VAIKERVNFAFRAEFQNILNHPWFALILCAEAPVSR